MSTSAVSAADFRGTIDQYRQAFGAMLGVLEDSASSAAARQQAVLNTLVVRDEVARAIMGSTPSAREIEELAEADRQLKDKASDIERVVGRPVLANWREGLQPPLGHRSETGLPWWWCLDDRDAPVAPQPKPLWFVLLAVCSGFAALFVWQIVVRWFSSSDDTISATLQGAMGLITTGAVVQFGRELLTTPEARPSGWPGSSGARSLPARFALPTLLLTVAVIFYFNQDYLAQLNSLHAEKAEENGDLGDAMVHYQRALRFEPHDGMTHYRLAMVFEKLGQLDDATAEYRNCLKSFNWPMAYVRLARLGMHRSADYIGAVQWLEVARKTLQDRKVSRSITPNYRIYMMYVIQKYLGWAYWGMHDYSTAEACLHDALVTAPDGRAVHFVRAQLWESTQPGHPDVAAKEWQQGLDARGIPHEEIDRNWITVAEARVAQDRRRHSGPQRLANNQHA